MRELHQTGSGTITEASRAQLYLYVHACRSETSGRSYSEPDAHCIRPGSVPAKITADLWHRFRLLGTEGLVGMAMAALDMAMWDALPRTQQLSLANYFGVTAKPVPAYGATVFEVRIRWPKRPWKMPTQKRKHLRSVLLNIIRIFRTSWPLNQAVGVEAGGRYEIPSALAFRVEPARPGGCPGCNADA